MAAAVLPVPISAETVASTFQGWGATDLVRKMLDSWNEVDNNAELELEKSKEYHAKLKFNWIELETKARFMEYLLDDTFPSPESIAEKDEELQELKIKRNKQKKANKRLAKQLTEALSAFAADYERLEEGKKEVTESTGISAAVAASFCVSFHQQSVLEERARRTALLTSTIATLAGVEVRSFDGDELMLRIQPPSTSIPTMPQHGYTLVLHFHTGTSELAGIELSPADIPYRDIEEYFGTYSADDDTNNVDLCILVREIQTRIANHSQRKAELAALNQRYVFNWQIESPLVTVTAPSGWMATIAADYDYPQPHAQVSIEKIEGHATRTRQQLEELRTAINDQLARAGPGSASITKILALLEQALQ